MGNEAQNTKTVQEMYEAFGRGDVASIMSHVGTPIDWWHHGTAENIPWAKRRTSREDVEAFFADLGGAAEVTRFEVRDYIAQGDKVIALGVFGGKARTTGKAFEERWAMEWTLRDGKVVQYEAFDDTAALTEAFRK